MHPKNIKIADYTYDLPFDRIAKYPLANREESKLLIYKNGIIQEDRFYNIDEYLPDNSTLIINESKVIPARIYMTSSTGKKHEVFCLEPIANPENKTHWKCFARGIGKKMDDVFIVKMDTIELKGRVIQKIDNAYVFSFEWQPNHLSFTEILTQIGEMPIPPYLKRKSEASDKKRYQTVYAKKDGSVAAPTAGLHFTEEVFEKLLKKNITTQKVTLHVGAGTFQPVKSEAIKDHTMHKEWIEVKRETIERLMIDKKEGKTLISVGTTSLRTIESVYWMGVKCIEFGIESSINQLEVKQWDVYELPQHYSLEEAFEKLLVWMEFHNTDRLIAQTQLLITPSYSLRVVSALITNFHQPNSTLLLLVASILKGDWKKVYEYALQNDFRFLSYGDSSLLFNSTGNKKVL